MEQNYDGSSTGMYLAIKANETRAFGQFYVCILKN